MGINIESNFLDSDGCTMMAKNVKANKDSKIEVWRLANQRQIGEYFGRPVEEAFCQMMQSNENIVRLGFPIADANWLDQINRCLLRNADYARRRRKRQGSKFFEDVKAVDHPLQKVLLQGVPQMEPSQAFADSAQVKMIRGFVAEKLKFPTAGNIQEYARSASQPLKYSEVKPLVEGFRQAILNAAKETKVACTDPNGNVFVGQMRDWADGGKNNWSLDVWQEETDPPKRFNFKMDSPPPIDISPEWGAWLKQ